jgi:hypothetical protein
LTWQTEMPTLGSDYYDHEPIRRQLPPNKALQPIHYSGLSPSLADSAARPPGNPGFPPLWGEQFKPGQALSEGQIRVVP